MTAQTHKQFAITWTYLGAIVLYYLNITNINYYLMLAIMLAIAKVGASFPDLDHEWKNVKDKTTITWIINKIIHITGGKHRSWQTHSWDICIYWSISCYFLSYILFKKGLISDVNFELLSIITIGFNLGWVSHLFSDMLTSGGVRIFCFIKHKVAFVPKSAKRINLILFSLALIIPGTVIFINKINTGIIIIAAGLGILYIAIRLGNVRFNTGNEWEAFVYRATKTFNKVLGLTAVTYPLIYTWVGELVLEIIK